MTEYLTEEEQLQQLKNWVKRYGLAILSGILIALILTTAWHRYQKHVENTFLHASTLYETMLQDQQQHKTRAVLNKANQLLKQYKNTPYAQMAGLMLARDAIENNQFAEAEQHLQWVMTHGIKNPLQEIARLRLARLFIAEKKPAQSLKLLADHQEKDSAFTGLINEIRGDALLAQNNPDAARAAYKIALSKIPASDSSLLQMKYDALAISDTQKIG